MRKYKGYLIGKKITSSNSKEIYTTVNSQIEYKNKEIKNSKDLSDFVFKKDFDFINITNPYKKEVIDYLDYESELVKKIGVCNLVVNRNGVLKGYNTDYFGFKSLLKLNNIDVKGKKCLILGNGCTAKTIEYLLNELNASYVECGCRTYKNILKVEKEFSEVNKDAQIIINSTPLGYYENDKRLLNLKEFKNLEVFIDCCHTPYRTPMMIDAIELGKGAINGYDMLFFQAYQAYTLATKNILPMLYWLSIRRNLILNKINIVFTGLPTSGKSKIINEYKKRFNTKGNNSLIDTDAIIEDHTKMSISKFFNEYGEEEFRYLEKDVCSILKDRHGILISTGGGTIIDRKCYRDLSKNGFIVYLKKTNFNDFKDDGKRPLVKSKEDMEKLYKKRNPIYTSRADFIIDSSVDSEKLLEEVMHAIVGY